MVYTRIYVKYGLAIRDRRRLPVFSGSSVKRDLLNKCAKQASLYFVLCPKQGPNILEDVVLQRDRYFRVYYRGFIRGFIRGFSKIDLVGLQGHQATIHLRRTSKQDHHCRQDRDD